MAKRTHLCDVCTKRKNFKTMTGKCTECGGFTAYSVYKLCYSCAKEKNVCQICLIPVQN